VSSAEAYAAAYPSCMLALGDLNGDGQVNTFDIDLFVDVMGGNLMSARRYQYDEENRLTAVAEIDGNPLLEIEYDALGRRIATIDYEAPGGPQQMRHVYSGLNTVAEYVWSGSQWTLAREVLWGERFPEPLALFDFTAAGDEQANSAGTADLPQPGEWWTANSEDGGATANSSFSVHQYGATLVAALSQQINCNAGQQATAAGTAYLQVRVTNVPGGGQIAHLRVNTYRTVRPSTSLNGEVKFNGTGVPLTEDYVSSSSEVYEIDLANGGWIPVTRLGI